MFFLTYIRHSTFTFILSVLAENGLELSLSSESDEELEFDRLATSSSLSLLETAESLPSEDDVSVLTLKHSNITVSQEMIVLWILSICYNKLLNHHNNCVHRLIFYLPLESLSSLNNTPRALLRFLLFPGSVGSSENNVMSIPDAGIGKCRLINVSSTPLMSQ